MGTVDLLTRLAIVNTRGISCPDGVLSRVKLEGSSSFSKSENSSILEICGDFEVLILEDERVVGGIEEYFTSVLTPDLQVELITWNSDCVIEHSFLGRVLSYLRVREWLFVRKCESFIVDISDLELQFIVIVES